MIVRWIFISIHGDIQDHSDNQWGVQFPDREYHTVAQPCSDWGLFSPRRDCIPQSSDKAWIREDGFQLLSQSWEVWLSLPQKAIWILEADLLYWALSSTWGQLNLYSDCDFLPAKRKPILSSFSPFSIFALSENVSCESLLTLMKFQIIPFIILLICSVV